MDFDFNEEQYVFQETFKNFLSEQYPLEKHITLVESGERNGELWSQLVELGLFSLIVPEHFGGLGMSFVDMALIMEELGKNLVPPPVAETIIATDLIARFGSDDQKNQYLPGIAEGRLKFSIATLEEGAGFHPADGKTTIAPSPDGFALTGKKILVPQADVVDAILVIGKMADTGNLAIAIIDAGSEGVALRKHNALDDSCYFHEVSFDNVKLTAEKLLSSEGSDIGERLFDVSAAINATQLIGIAGRMLDIAVDYACQREQFGVAIGSFQAIKHKCANIAVDVDGGRSAAYYAMWAIAEDAPDRAKAVSVAKSFCGEAARLANNDGIQIHGGMGFTWELGLHHYLRRTKVLEYSAGDAAYHRERVMAETLTELSL